jgi:hypothetical protein
VPDVHVMHKLLRYNALACFAAWHDRDIAGSICPKHRTLQWRNSRDSDFLRHSAELRFQPVPARADVHDEGHRERRGTLHLGANELSHLVELGPRYLEHELVVHL